MTEEPNPSLREEEFSQQVDRASEQDERTDAVENTPKKKSKGSSVALILSSLALLISLSGLATGYYLYQQEVTKKTGGSSELIALQDQFSAKTADLAAQLENNLASSQLATSQTTQDQLALNQRQQALEDHLSLLRAQTNWGKREWSLAEISYLVQIASDRLMFMRDKSTAITALKTALVRLERMADSSLASLRHRLQNDISMLEAHQAENPLDALQQLEDNISNLSPIHLSAETTAGSDAQAENASNTGTPKPTLKQSVQNTLAKRFRIRHHEQPLNALNHNTISWHNLSILQLKMEGLRLALQQDNQTAFKQSLISIREWVVGNLETMQQQPLLKTIEKLDVDKVFIALPALEDTQSILRALMANAS